MSIACAPPLPNAVPLANVESAAAAVLLDWGEAPGNHPAIWGVPSDCMAPVPPGYPVGAVSPGFVDPLTGSCKGGFSDEGGAIYLVVHPWVTYADVLPHELVHHLRGDDKHRNPSLWGPEGSATIEGVGESFLRARADLNTMEVAP